MKKRKKRRSKTEGGLSLIHIYRDLLLDKEVEEVCKKIQGDKIIPFITEQSDIEAYCVTAKHISRVLGIEKTQAEEWIDAVSYTHLERTPNRIKLNNARTW